MEYSDFLILVTNFCLQLHIQFFQLPGILLTLFIHSRLQS